MRRKIAYFVLCVAFGSACGSGPSSTDVSTPASRSPSPEASTNGLTRSAAEKMIENDPRFRTSWVNHKQEPMERDFDVTVTGLSEESVSVTSATFTWHFKPGKGPAGNFTGEARFQKYDDGWRLRGFRGDGLPIY